MLALSGKREMLIVNLFSVEDDGEPYRDEGELDHGIIAEVIWSGGAWSRVFVRFLVVMLTGMDSSNTNNVKTCWRITWRIRG